MNTKEIQDERFKQCVSYLHFRGIRNFMHISPFAEGNSPDEVGSCVHRFTTKDTIYVFQFDENEEWELTEYKV